MVSTTSNVYSSQSSSKSDTLIMSSLEREESRSESSSSSSSFNVDKPPKGKILGEDQDVQTDEDEEMDDDDDKFYNDSDDDDVDIDSEEENDEEQKQENDNENHRGNDRSTRMSRMSSSSSSSSGGRVGGGRADIMALLSRADSSRHLTRSLLQREESSSQLLKRGESSRSLMGGGDFSTRRQRTSTSDTFPLTDDDDDDDDDQSIDSTTAHNDDDDENDERSSNDKPKASVEDLLLRVDTFHRSTRSFLRTSDTTTSTTDSGYSKEDGDDSSTAEPSSKSKPSSLDDMIEKTRQELIALKEQGTSKRQEQEEKVGNLQGEFDEKELRLKSKLSDAQDPLKNEKLIYKRIMEDNLKQEIKKSSSERRMCNSSSSLSYNNPSLSVMIGTLDIHTKLLRAVHMNFVVLSNQVRLTTNSMMDIDKVLGDEVIDLKQRLKQSQLSLMEEQAKATNRNVVLYDYYQSKLKLQTKEMNEMKTKLTSICESNEEEKLISSGGRRPQLLNKRSVSQWMNRSMRGLGLGCNVDGNEDTSKPKDIDDATTNHDEYMASPPS